MYLNGPVLVVENAFLSPLCCINMLRKQVTMCVYVFWYSIPWINLSNFAPILYCVNFCNSIISRDSWQGNTPLLSFIKIVMIVFDFFTFLHNLVLSSQFIYTFTSARILIQIGFNWYLYLGRIDFCNSLS
jgi:hypothetical protein